MMDRFGGSGSRRHWILALMAGAIVAGCDGPTARRSPALRSRGREVDVYLQGVAATLNDLPNHIDLQLLPAQPILTASNSADGNEVRATCTAQTPGGPINYLRAVDGNANFFSLDVQPGDILRYYVMLDEEVAERGIEQRTALELRVRRLDVSGDPQNALIIEGSLNAPVTEPQRIEIWRYSDERVDAIRSALNRYEKLRDPPVGWEPSPDLGALQQIVEHANQWLRSQPPAPATWTPDSLLAGLPAELRQAKGVAEAIEPEALRNGTLSPGEGRYLAQAIWCRDIGQWARASSVSDAEVANALFDWTVRNIQLDEPEGAAIIHHPWQAMVYGHGDASHRAWTFVELCRQQGIDAVVVRPQPTTEAAGDAEAPLLVGALIEEDLRLYDPRLGLSLVGPEGAATLQDLSARPELLRSLDAGDQFTYSLDSERLAEVEALVVASPLQLSRRSQLMENGFQGEEVVILHADLRPLVERLEKVEGVKTVSLWSAPFQAIADEHTTKPSVRRRAAAEFAKFAEKPELWQARVLHFQGFKEVRVSERDDPLAEPRQGHKQAVVLYQKVRPSNAELAKQAEQKRAAAAAAKAAASYWLGLLSYERGEFNVAVRWLQDRTLKPNQDGRWANGARYNLARTWEALGEVGKAVAQLEATSEDDPQRHGNLVRAQRLRQSAPAGPLRQ